MRKLLFPTLAVAVMNLTALTVYADPVNLEWAGSGMASRLGYYRPLRMELSPTRPSHVTRIPSGVASPLFGTIFLGPRDAGVEINLLLDEPDNGTAHLWVDANGNGDLTDDPPVEWSAHRKEGKDVTTVSWSGTAGVSVNYGRQRRTLGFHLYRFDKNDPARQNQKNALFYYRDFGWSGNVAFDGKSFPVVLVDDSARGDFRPTAGAQHPDVSLLIDLNHNGAFETRGESFDVLKPFNIGGTTYEISGLTAEGGSFQLARSSQTVEESTAPATTEAGGKPVAFEESSTTGQPVHFPSDYRGKLVLLDFWATWCGPCRRELPNLAKVYEEFHPRGFEVLGVSLDNEQSMQKLAQFTADNHMPWTQICEGKGWDGKLVHRYGVSGIPFCLLVDGNTGLIVARVAELRGPALRPTIERCLAGLGTAPANSPVAEAPRSNPVPPSKPAPEDPLAQKARELARADKLLSVAHFNVLRKFPKPAPVVLIAASTQPLRGREIAERASQAYVRAGWIYHCSKCDRWHVKLAGGYAIAKDTIVTAWHVMEPPETIKQGEGYPVVVRGDDEILPILTVLAAGETSDAIILRVAARDLRPLALSAAARRGDAAYCLSDPHGMQGYFSSGIVNRFYTRPGGSAGNPADRRVNVSTDWAPGSSGSAVLDECANVIGHVSRIQPVLAEKHGDSSEAHDGATAPAVMTLHEAVSAQGVLKLLETMDAGAAK